MSSYWAAYYGVALVLNEQEYIDMSNRFGEISPDYLENGDLLEEGDDIIFKNSARKTVKITQILADNCDGMCLIPFVQEDGEPNIFVAGGEKEPPLRTVEAIDMRGGQLLYAFCRQGYVGTGSFSRHLSFL